jgi:hypothetical protein
MLGIAVPCYKYHIPVLKRFLDSVEAQTVKPEYVVVSCSSSTQEDILNYAYSFPLQVIPFEGRLNASQNRNKATDILIKLGCSYISFFDCDDVMHPQRIQGIKEGFSTFPETQIILHSFWLTKGELEQEFEHYNSFQYVVNNLRKAPSGCAELIENWQARLHHSQGSVTKELFTNVRFREEKEFERKEDSIFCGDCLSLGIPNLYIRNPLSKYYEEGKWFS